MNRRHLLSISLTAAAGGLLAGCAGPEQQAGPGPVSRVTRAATIGLTYIPNIQFAPFYWAQDKRLFDAQGVTTTLRHHGAQEGLFTALVAGTEQFVIAGGDEMLQARSQGMDLVAIATMYQSYPVVVIVPEASPITSLADLKGHTIGVPGKYGETWFGLLVALRTAGLTEADVTIQTIGYTQQAALTTGKVDAIVGFSNNDAVQFATNKVAVRQIPLGDEVPLVGICLVSTRSVLDADPGLAKGVAQAMVQGVQQVVADPEGAVKTSVAHVPGLDQADAQAGALTTLQATIPLLTGGGEVTGRLDPAAWTAMAEFMSSAGLVSGTIDAAAAIDTSILG